jgi:hypothetical protein
MKGGGVGLVRRLKAVSADGNNKTMQIMHEKEIIKERDYDGIKVGPVCGRMRGEKEM